jgi:general secretion pathway protein D
LHDTKDVTLQLEFEIKALSGSSINGIPVISNRTVTQTVRLKEDETSLITGLLSDNESKSLSGIPGLVQLPGIGYAFGPRNYSFTNDELLFLITPRRMRSPFHPSKAVYAGTGDPTGRSGVGGGGFRPEQESNPAITPSEAPAPTPAAPPPQSPPPAQPQPQPEIPQQEPPG